MLPPLSCVSHEGHTTIFSVDLCYCSMFMHSYGPVIEQVIEYQSFKCVYFPFTYLYLCVTYISVCRASKCFWCIVIPRSMLMTCLFGVWTSVPSVLDIYFILFFCALLACLSLSDTLDSHTPYFHFSVFNFLFPHFCLSFSLCYIEFAIVSLFLFIWCVNYTITLYFQKVLRVAEVHFSPVLQPFTQIRKPNMDHLREMGENPKPEPVSTNHCHQQAQMACIHEL